MKHLLVQILSVLAIAGVAMAGKIVGGGNGTDPVARATADAALVRSNFTVLCVSGSCITNWPEVGGGSNSCAWSAAPVATNSVGNPGDLAYTNDYFYICIASNLWRRATLVGF